jgi:hypothetical protein
MVAKETGWSFREIMWQVPASVTMQIYDVAMSQHVDLRWSDSDVDIDAIING